MFKILKVANIVIDSQQEEIQESLLNLQLCIPPIILIDFFLAYLTILLVEKTIYKSLFVIQ